jgi:rubrerythrin
MHETQWVQVPLASAQDFFNVLEPKLQELEALRKAETAKLETEILDLGDAVEDVVQPVREGFEAKRDVSYRDLYFWREMFRLYMEKPIFYSETESRRGALTFNEAKGRLQEYDSQLRQTGLLAKMRTPAAKQAAQHFLDLNVDILKIMHFQEMNARAMTKILKKFDKRTHLEGQVFVQNLRKQYPALLTNGKITQQQSAGGFANSIARDLHAEIATKILAIVPQLDDWNCPVCYSMAWRPVNLGCCRSVFCITCIIKLQDEKVTRCPVCNQETVLTADGRNLDFEAMDFLEKFFPMEVKKRQKENEKAVLVRTYGEEFVKPGCVVQ